MIQTMPETEDTKRLNAIFKYVTYVADNSPKDANDAAVFDARRRSLHDAVAEAYRSEPYFSKSTTEEIKRFLYDLNDIENFLKVNKDIFKRPSDAVEYLFYRNQDRINERTEGPNRFATEYALKEWIDGAIERIKKTIKPDVDQCRRITDAYAKARDNHNEHIDYHDEKYCHRYFEHESNGNLQDIRDCLENMEAFAKLPREAYLKSACEKYFHGNAEHIFECVKKMKVNAFNCLMFWKNESGFWDEKFEF